SFLIVSVLSFLIFVKHIRKVTDPFVDPGLGKNIPFMIGVLCGGIIFGTVAGFVSMVPYMMKDVHQLSTAEIGRDRKSTRLNSSHVSISYAVFCLKKKKKKRKIHTNK